MAADSAALFVASGLGLSFFKKQKSKPEKLAIALALIPLSYLPNLLVQDSGAV